MGKAGSYTLKEYPEPKSFLDMLFGDYKKNAGMKAMKEQLGEDGYQTFTELKKVKALTGIPQAKLPFELSIE
jgi:hypothetical protein